MNKKIFLLILVLAFALRFYKLGGVPLSLDWDENSNAYNAYSILKTGRDEYGNFLPSTNRSFNDYKPPLYMYLDVPTVAIFGLTPFAARLPSALFGFLTVPAIYFLAKKLFEVNGQLAAIKKRSANLEFKSKLSFPPQSSLRQHQITDKTQMFGKSWLRHVFDWRQSFLSSVTGQVSNVIEEAIALLAMFLLAISPWHLQFSRVGFEANVGLFFAVATATFLLYAIFPNQENGNLKKSFLWVISAIFFGISLYSYHAERVFLPLLFLISAIIWKHEIFSVNKKNLVVFLFICTLFVLPLVLFLSKEAISQRFKSTTKELRVESLDKSAKFITEDQKVGFEFGKYIHDQRLIIAQSLLPNYLANFDLNFLFIKGDDNLRHHIDGMGMLYLFELPLIVFGIYQLVKIRNKQSSFLLSWFLISPIAASLTNESPHAVRSLTMVIATEIISAYALFKIFQIFKYKTIFITLSSIIIISSLVIYLHNYYSHYRYNSAPSWQFGYSQAVEESEKLKSQYNKVIINSSIEQAYIFWLFNTKYNPVSYQKLGTRDHFDKYYFNSQASAGPDELYVSDAKSFPLDFEVSKTVYYPNGEEAIKIGHPK